MTRELTALAVLFAVLSARAAARAADCVGAMRPNADLTVYFDTKQAERAMAPEIWKMIQLDKKNAAARSKGKKTFNTEDRDVVGCVNVDFPNFDPFSFKLDGLLNVSGGRNASARNDVRDFAAAFRELGYKVAEGGSTKKPSCKVYMAANDLLPDSGAELVSEDDGILRIAARWGLKEQDTVTRQEEVRLAGLLSAHPVNRSSLVLVGDAKKLSKLPLDGNASQRALKQLLQKLDTFRLDVTAQGDALAIRALLRFLNEKDAAAYRKLAQVDASAFATGNNNGLLRKLTSDGEGLDLNVMLSLDIKAAWSFLGRFEQNGAQKKRKVK